MIEKWEAVDSLRLAMRRAADNGRLLQWGDSLLRIRYSKGEIDKEKYDKMLAKLSRIDRKLHMGDSLLEAHGKIINYDTVYLTKPQGRWTIKLRSNISGAQMDVDGNVSSTSFHGRTQADFRGTLSMAVSYRGLSMGIAINPAKLAGKSKDNEFNLNSYGNKFGFDVVYLQSETYKGNVSTGGQAMKYSKGMIQQKALNINAYYAFNGRKFSFPAAFSQSYIQKRSAGSILIGMSIDGQMTDIDGSALTKNESVDIKLIECGIGIGYGYNFVVGRHWLFHVSTLPTFDVYTHSNITFGDTRVNMKYYFPSVILTGRSATVYSWRHKFAGVTFVINSSCVGYDDQLQIKRDKWRVRLFYGFRF